MRFDLSMLFYVIPAAVIGGLWGASLACSEALREINAEQLGYDVPLTVTVRQMKKLLKEPEKIFSWSMKILLKKQLAMYKESYESIFSDPMFNIMALAVCLNMLKKEESERP